MTSRRNRVLHAAIVFALSQGALAESTQPPAQATDSPAPQAAGAPIQVAQAAPGDPAASKQGGKESAANEEVTKGEQVVVTARRRAELIQDVPGAVSAYSGVEMERKGIQDITGLADLTPNTTLKTSRATNSTLTAFIRGIGQQDPVAGYEQGVGIYLDDIYLARPQGALMDIYDLARIEVLRGPQGTLYGRNTIGGAVKYVTRRLTPDPELSVRMTAGNYGEKDLVVRGNLPISNEIRLGAAVATFDHDGFGKNVVNGVDNYNKNVVAGRISAEFMPTPSLFIRVAADHTTDDSLPKQGYRLTVGPPPTNEPVLSGNYDTRANLYTVLGRNQEVVTWGDSLLVEWTVNPDLLLKYVTALRKGQSVAPIDFDSLNEPLFEAPAFYNDRQTSHELQLTYTGDRLQGVAGAYFMKANAFNEFDVLFNASGGLSLYTLDDIDTKTWAAYADASYSLTPTVDVTVGGRYTSDNRKARIYKRTYLGLSGSPTLGNPNAFGLPANTDLNKDDLDRTDTKFTPKVGVGWKFTPGQNLYLTYAQGFKGGFFDPRMDLGGNPDSPTSIEKRKGVKPEEAATYELGLKSAYRGGRIQTNIAAFYTDYTNVQIPGSIPTYDANGNVTGFAGNVTNAGKAKIQGLEFETIARLTDSFTVTGMVGLIDAKYKEWIVANGLTGSAAALINVASSAEFQNTPKTQASITGTYEWPLAIMGRGGSIALQGTASYKSKVYQSEFVHPTGVPSLDVNLPGVLSLAQDAYTLVDAGITWTSSDHHIQVGLVGRNLTDKRYIVAGYPFGSFFNTVTAFYGDPRTVKLSVSLSF